MVWVVLVGAYLLGSMPFGLVLAKIFCKVDPRQAGSGNIGATNVARLCGIPWGVATLVLDMLKGMLSVLVAQQVSGSVTVWSLAAFLAVLGHTYPLFLRFKGGKAVSATIGAYLLLAFMPLLIVTVMCVLVIVVSGFVSLGSLILVTALPVLLWCFGQTTKVPLALAIAVLVYWRHRENIGRLLRGEEKSWH
ncbi:Glycerol-3-phosphate acyltransferase [Desulfovibrionales bacterium]